MTPLRTLSLTALFLLLALGAAPAQEGKLPVGEKPATDIMEITPEALRGEDVDALVSRAHRAYQEKRYEDAARTFIAALRRNPGDSTSLYNLACCYGLLGAPGQATAFLEAAWQAGFRDLGHIRRDADFEKVREDAGFAGLLERLAEDDERRGREDGKRLLVESGVVASVRVVAPQGEREPWDRLPLVIGLHGLGGDAAGFVRLFNRIEKPVPFLYCVPQAPYAFGGGSRLGYSWSLRDPGAGTAAQLRSRLLAERYVLDVLAAVKREYRVDERRVFLLGFSQGAGMAFTIGLKHPEIFRGVIPVGGWSDPGEHRPADLDRVARHGQFLVCHSPEDRVVTFSRCETAEKLLREHEIPHRVLRYEGGHSMPRELLERIVAWIEKPETAMRSEAAPTK
jgi:phospholipase/carboxylesterase